MRKKIWKLFKQFKSETGITTKFIVYLILVVISLWKLSVRVRLQTQRKQSASEHDSVWKNVPPLNQCAQWLCYNSESSEKKFLFVFAERLRQCKVQINECIFITMEKESSNAFHSFEPRVNFPTISGKIIVLTKPLFYPSSQNDFAL